MARSLTPHTTSVVSAVRASRPSVSCTPRDWTSAVWVVIITGLIADGAAEEGPDHASGPSSLAGHPWLVVPFHFFFLLRVFLNRMWISPTRRGSISRMTSWGMATTGREDVALALSVPVCSRSFDEPGSADSPRLSDTVRSPLPPCFLPFLLPDGAVRNGS